MLRPLLLVLSALCGLLLLAFLYQQVLVEGGLGPAAAIGAAVLASAFAALVAMYFLATSSYREVVAKALLAAVSIVVTYFVIDIGAGFVLIRPLSPPLVQDPVRHHKMVPNSFSEFRQRDFAYVQRVNNFGMRGADIEPTKPAETYRVLMLGDSFTMGKGVEDGETFSALIGGRLERAAAECGGKHVQVLNGGVDSYAPILSYLQLKNDLLSLEPDLVVLNFDNSDLIQETVYRHQAEFSADGEPVAVPPVGQRSVYERFRSWTERHLFFTRLVLVYANRAFDYGELSVRQVVNELGREHFAHTLEGDVDRTAQWEAVFDSLTRIKELADGSGIELLVTTYPWAHQINDTDWVPGRYAYMRADERTTDSSVTTMRRMSAQAGIEFLALHSAFEDYAGTEKLYFDYDPHWTKTGHEVMANALGAFLGDRYSSRFCGSLQTND